MRNIKYISILGDKYQKMASKWSEKEKNWSLSISIKLLDSLSPQDFQPSSWFLGISGLTVLVAAPICYINAKLWIRRSYWICVLCASQHAPSWWHAGLHQGSVRTVPSPGHCLLSSLCKALWTPHGASAHPIACAPGTSLEMVNGQVEATRAI